MVKKLIRGFCFASLTAAVLSLPCSLKAQTKPAADVPTGIDSKKPAVSAKKPSAGPFHGKLASLDKAAKTITVGKRTFHITPETKIRKSDRPARLEDGVIGEQCSGYVKPDQLGRLVATTVNLGPKTQARRREPQAPDSK